MTVDLVKEYLIHSYLYYIKSETIIDDHSFDRLCDELQEAFPNIESPYKQYIDKYDTDQCFKGQDGREDIYPEEIKRLALIRLEDHKAFLEVFKINDKEC